MIVDDDDDEIEYKSLYILWIVQEKKYITKKKDVKAAKYESTRNNAKMKGKNRIKIVYIRVD